MTDDIAPDLPADWAEAIARIPSDRALRRVAVLGPPDAGKSTFCRALLARAPDAALLDLDVGQPLAGPPACLTLDSGRGRALAFVGTTDPVRGWRRLVEGAGTLARAAPAGLLVANTDGLLRGPGIALKRDLLAALAPDLVVTLGETPLPLDPIPVLRLAPSPLARRKGPGERRRARRAAFARVLEDTADLDLPAHLVDLEPSDGPLPPGLLLGLRDRAGRDLGIGLLDGLEDGRVRLRTAVSRDAIAAVLPGAMTLDSAFGERHIPINSA